MATGVRLYHETLRNVVYLVEHPRKYKGGPFLCPGCRRAHDRKTYHLKLDDAGSTIVSEKIYQRLQEAGMPGLILANAVAQPPAQAVSIEQLPLQIVEHATKESRLTIIRKRLLKPTRVIIKEKKDG